MLMLNPGQMIGGEVHYTCHGCRYENDPHRKEFLYDSPWDWLPEDERDIPVDQRHYIAGGGTLFVEGCSPLIELNRHLMEDCCNHKQYPGGTEAVCIGKSGCVYWTPNNNYQLKLF